MPSDRDSVEKSKAIAWRQFLCSRHGPAKFPVLDTAHRTAEQVTLECSLCVMVKLESEKSKLRMVKTTLFTSSLVVSYYIYTFLVLIPPFASIHLTICGFVIQALSPRHAPLLDQ